MSYLPSSDVAHTPPRLVGSLLSDVVAAIAAPDETARAQARTRQDQLTKPSGSLGVLEDIGVQLAALSGVCPPPIPDPATVVVFAADHGVHAQAVSPWPQEVTAQMVANFLAGGAAINAFAAQAGAGLLVVDVGVASPLPDQTAADDRLRDRRVRAGTADMTREPAMSRAQAITAIEVGIQAATDLVAAGTRCLLAGDMGIANTTASSALIAAMTGRDPSVTTGRGTGINEDTWRHKVTIVRQALDLHRPDPSDPVGVLAAVGGLEHAAIAGLILGAAAANVPVILDGVITGSAALIAAALAPHALNACIAGHRSAEPGHTLALQHLQLRPLIDLGLRLGEGTGAALALPLVQAAARALAQMATFDTAGVAEASQTAHGGSTNATDQA
ncbi:MAG TPA: nicotinate-nucleotide--dimethylbenzimidazole phosphoribosyltransferase [Kineosporiaceae bacterium]|nr:nicotinate-nucleotide--dimethylbenzimidazole phosphoribosyltransferase [Kineosporiaceae bacterium]